MLSSYDSPLPTLPPDLSTMSDEDIPSEPLPPIPSSRENATSDGGAWPARTNSAGGESGIDMDGADDGYVDDARADTPFLPPAGNKPIAIDISKAKKVPETKVFIKGSRERIETEF